MSGAGGRQGVTLVSCFLRSCGGPTRFLLTQRNALTVQVLGGCSVACSGQSLSWDGKGWRHLGGFPWALESLGRLLEEPLSRSPELILKVSEAQTAGMGDLCLPAAPSPPQWASSVWREQVWEAVLPWSPETGPPFHLSQAMDPPTQGLVAGLHRTPEREHVLLSRQDLEERAFN